MTANAAGANSAMPLTPLHKDDTTSRWRLSLVIPSFVENSGHLLRLYERAGSNGQVRTHMKTSKLEEEALRQILAAGIAEPEREYQFLEDRKFRFDFAWLRHKVALEVEGGIWINGGHSTGYGIERDMEKYNLAQINGWTVLRVSSGHIRRGEVGELLKKVL
jgi:very-short-patch-repair endonuclease